MRHSPSNVFGKSAISFLRVLSFTVLDGPAVSGATAEWSSVVVATVLGNGSSAYYTLLSAVCGYPSSSIPNRIWVRFERTGCARLWSTWTSVAADRIDPSLRCHDSLAANFPSVWIGTPIAVLGVTAFWSSTSASRAVYVDNGMASISAPVSGRNFTSCRAPLSVTSTSTSTSSLSSIVPILTCEGVVRTQPADIFWSLFPVRQTSLKCPDFPQPVHTFP